MIRIIIILLVSLLSSEGLTRNSCIADPSRVERMDYTFPEILENSHFVIHFTTMDVDSQWVNEIWMSPQVTTNYAQSILDLLEYSLSIFMSQNWEMPPPDCDDFIEDLNSASHCVHFGGNAKYDVYISNEGVGMVVPEAVYPVEPYTSGWSSFMHITSLQNQYDELPFWSHHVIAHELHHAIQMRYGSGTSGTPGNYTHNLWFFEQTATYMENVIFPNNIHLRTMLSNCDVVTPLTFPEHQISYPAEIYPYRSALWHKFLVDNYNDSAIVRYQWEEYGLQYATGQNVSLYPIYNNSISIATNQEINLEQAIGDYGLWRYFTGNRNINNEHFTEGNLYCTAKTFVPEEVSIIISEMGSAYFIELPNENHRVNINVEIAGIITAQYVLVENGNPEIVDIDMSQTTAQFDYYYSETNNHVLIITSGYTGGESIDIPINISLQESILIGDVNSDMEINILDVVLLVNHILDNIELTDEQLIISDLNQDGVVNIIDVVLLVNMILSI